MTRWKITVEYEGAGFCGWQRQPQVVTVQGVLEEAIYKLSGEPVVLHVAGRTDAGVHAFANVAHFDVQKDFPAATIRDALNHYVRPHRVSVLSAEAMPDNFHARFHATARSYRYLVLNRHVPSALWCDRAWHVHGGLDLDLMQKAADLLIGRHDFSTFRAQSCQANSPIRTLDQLKIMRDGDMVTFHVHARSFLYHQVRNMVGTLVLVGKGRWSLDDFKTAFAACDRRAGGPTAPAHGLYFVSVTYTNPPMKCRAIQ